MNAEDRRRWVEDRLIAVVVGTDQIDDPHLVVVTDTESGTATYFGPYPDAASALRDADHLRHELHDGEGRGEVVGAAAVTTVVARLYAPTAPGPTAPAARGEVPSPP